jgi:F0F1-type ATP synthase delta subunit
MKEKIIFIFALALLSVAQITAQENNREESIKNSLYQLKQIFGDSFFESLYSIDELRPYSIIQIDKIAREYDNSWISPKTFVSQLNEKDKIKLTEKISEYIADLEDAFAQNQILTGIKSWCISANQLNLIAHKIGIGRTNVLNIVMMFLPAPVNTNTGEIISTDNSKNNGEYYYYSTINQLSNLSQKEQFRLYSKIFGELAQK